LAICWRHWRVVLVILRDWGVFLLWPIQWMNPIKHSIA